LVEREKKRREKAEKRARSQRVRVRKRWWRAAGAGAVSAGVVGFVYWRRLGSQVWRVRQATAKRAGRKRLQGKSQTRWRSQ
jgi:hypothetical protein